MDDWLTDYVRMGLPGAIGSTDVKCSRQVGKLSTRNSIFVIWLVRKVIPLWYFRVGTVNHKMRFQSFTRGFYGATNDKAICKYDYFTQSLKNGNLFADNVFQLFDSDGSLVSWMNRAFISYVMVHSWNSDAWWLLSRHIARHLMRIGMLKWKALESIILHHLYNIDRIQLKWRQGQYFENNSWSRLHV